MTPKLKSKPKAEPKIAVTIKMTAKERDAFDQECWRMRLSRRRQIERWLTTN